MRPSRRTVLAAALLLAGLLVAVLLLPALARDAVTARVRAELDRRLDADVTWESARLSLIRDFPRMTLGLRGVTVVGEEPFAGDTLASLEALHLALDAGSVWRGWRGTGPVELRALELDAPDLRLVVLEDGRANWAVLADAGADPEGEEGAAAAGAARSGPGLAVELRRFRLTGGRVALDNRRSGLALALEGLDHELSGRFSGAGATARTVLHADRTDLTFAGTPWLVGAPLELSADLDVEPGAGRVVLRENELRLGELLLRLSGSVARAAPDLALDLAFEAPRSDFRQIASLVPALRERDFASLETSGSVAVTGSVQGSWGPEAFPALDLRASVLDGSFRYPDRPLAARGIGAELSVTNPGGDPDATVLRLDPLRGVVGENPLEGALEVRTPVSDPRVAARVEGTLDLGALARTVKLQEGAELAGSVTADASVRARRSAVEGGRWEEVEAEGTVLVREVRLASPALRHPVAVEEADLVLSPQRAQLRAFRARAGSSDLQASGTLENLLGAWLRKEPLRGRATFTSSRVVLDEWRSEREELEVIPVPALLELELEGRVDTLLLGELRMEDARGGVRVAGERVTLDGFTLRTLGGRIGVSGSYETSDPSRPTFDVGLTLDSLDIGRSSAALVTVRTLAPVARFARGSFSARLDLAGALGRDLTPAFEVLTGEGSLLTSPVTVEGFPLLQRLAAATGVERLAAPTLSALRSSVRIADGRLHVQPFQAGVAGIRLNVAGSNGIDRSLDYTLGLTLPRSAMGAAADRVVQELAARAQGVGLDLATADSVRLAVRVGGTVTEPTLDLGLGRAAASGTQALRAAAGAAVEARVDEARERLDSARAETEARARARADSIVAQAEARAEAIRAEGRRLAEAARAEADRRIEELLARAANPVARAAARPVADRMRQEAAERAERLVAEADERAEAVVEEARRRAAELTGAEGAPAADSVPAGG